MTPQRTTSSCGASPQVTAVPQNNMTLAFKDTPSTARNRKRSPVQTHTTASSASTLQTISNGGNQSSDAATEGQDDDQDTRKNALDSGDAHAPSALREAAHNLDATLASEKAKSEQESFNEQTGPHANETRPNEEGTFALVQEPRRPSFSEISASDNVSDPGFDSAPSDFDIADDDDDYAAVDQVSQASENDANIEDLDGHHMASTADDWSAPDPDVEMENADADAAADIDWDDHRTYDFEYSLPYSGEFPGEDTPMLDSFALGLPNSTQDMSQSATQAMGVPTTMNVEYDPHMVSPLFSEDISSSDESSTFSGPSANGGTQSQTEPPTPMSGGAVEDDTDSEDLTEEIERRRRLSKSRKKKEKSSKTKRSHKRHRSSISTHASKIQKFSLTPRRIHATGKMTARGRIICLSVTDRTKIRWITGRVPVDPAASTPSPELVKQLRSRMFQQAYCPDQATMNLIHELRASRDWSSGIFSQPTYHNSGLNTEDLANYKTLAAISGGDFTEYIDDDGEPGLTIAQNFMAPSGAYVMDSGTDLSAWTTHSDELDEAAPAMHSAGNENPATSGERAGPVNIDDSPCPKGKGTAKDHTEDDDQDDADMLEVQRQLFSSSPPQSNQISV